MNISDLERSINASLEKISDISEHNLPNVVDELPIAMSNFITVGNIAGNAKIKLEAKKKELTKKLYEHYLGKKEHKDLIDRLGQPTKMPMSSISIFVETDDEMVSIQQQLDRVEVILWKVKEAINMAKNVQWLVKTKLDISHANYS